MRDNNTYLQLLPSKIRSMFAAAELDPEELQEIRLRIGQPLLIRYEGREYSISGNGKRQKNAADGYSVTAADVKETLEQVTGYSVYAYDQEMKQGFLTAAGGHRIGVAGKIVCEDGKIQCISQVSGLNIRLAHQKKDCAKEILPCIIRQGEVCHTLIISPPGGGKTTMLRDLIRLISNGTEWFAGKNVGVVDERSEIAGTYHGEAQNDLGMRTDVLDCCPKAEGMMMLLRAMSPQVIAVDELGSERDQNAVKNVFYCGCTLLATAHGNSLSDIRKNPLLREMTERKMFERYILLGGGRNPGTVRMIQDGEGEVLPGSAEDSGRMEEQPAGKELSA